MFFLGRFASIFFVLDGEGRTIATTYSPNTAVDAFSVDNGGRCDLRVSFVLSVLRFFSHTFDGVIDKNTLSRDARMYSTCQNGSQIQHE